MADTIQSDVPAAAAPAAPAASDTGSTEIKKSSRELAMEALEARHQNEMAASNGYELMAEDEPAPAAPAAPADDQVAAQLTDPPAAAAEVPSTVRVKVDGVETEVPLDEVVRQYQKNSSADKRLNEATRILREAQEAESRRLLAEQQAQLAAQQQSSTAATNDAPAAEGLGESGKEFLKALFEGDEENALTALEKVIQGRQQAPATAPAPTLDIDQIASAVSAQVQQKFAVESALAQNRADYPEMYSDPDMEALALTKIQRLREQDGMEFFAALDTVSKDLATKFGWGASTPPGRQLDSATTTSSTRTAKLEQKRGIDNVASINTKTTTTEQQPENPSDVIAAMKAARAGG